MYTAHQYNSTQRKQTGARVIKPKKAALIKHQQIKKVSKECERYSRDCFLIPLQKHSSGLAAMTEKALASRAGHLELLHGGKKDAKAEKAKAAQAKK